jgi:hypothetical protein
MVAYEHSIQLETRRNVCYRCCQVLPENSNYCPHCGRTISCLTTPFAPSPDNAQVIETVEELEIDRLAPADYLLIRTRNSLYKFTLIEPVIGYGILTGGALGTRQIHASLIAQANCQDTKTVARSLRVSTGQGLLFYLDENQVEGNDQRKQVATSPIQKLTYVTGGKTTAMRPAPSPEFFARPQV